MNAIGRVAQASSVVLAIILAGCGTSTTPTTHPTSQPTTTPILTPAPTSDPPSASPTGTPAPVATQTPIPTQATAAPTAASTPSAPVGLILDPAAIDRHFDALQDIADQNDGIRAAGTPGYDASADYVEQQLSAMGYQVERTPVQFTSFRETVPALLEIGDSSWTGPEWLNSMLYSPSGDVTGVAETVGIVDGIPTANGACSLTEWSDFTPGNVAVVVGGPCRRLDILTNAQAVGAAAVISLYPTLGPNKVLQPTLIDPNAAQIPIVTAGREPSQALLAAASADQEVHLTTSVEMAPDVVENVIGELAGATDTVVMLGGHLDSVLAGPGLNDNGSGVSTLLAMAQSVVGGLQPRATIRFGFWAAEEFGDIGSGQYVNGLSEAERSRIAAYLNLDMVASPNAGFFVYDDPGSSSRSKALTVQIIDALAARGFESLRTDTGGASDHFAFELGGVPVGGVFSGISPLTGEEAILFDGTAGEAADPCYHLACDNRDNVDTSTAVTLGTAIGDVLVELAY